MIRRRRPSIWVTWLAKLMAGEMPCQWSSWFQTHYLISRYHRDSPELVAWQIAHTRMLSELVRDLARKGYQPRLEVPIRLDLPRYGLTIAGKIDCLDVEDDEVVVRDCKTGQPATSHKIQVMIYLHALAGNRAFGDRRLLGEVIYPQNRVEQVELPLSFGSQLDYFVGLLASTTPPIKVPGPSCRFCPISPLDCPDRVDWSLEADLTDAESDGVSKLASETSQRIC